VGGESRASQLSLDSNGKGGRYQYRWILLDRKYMPKVVYRRLDETTWNGELLRICRQLGAGNTCFHPHLPSSTFGELNAK
jgi:hypothetical protein